MAREMSARFTDGELITPELVTVLVDRHGLKINFKSKAPLIWPARQLEVKQRCQIGRPGIISSRSTPQSQLIIDDHASFQWLYPLLSRRHLYLVWAKRFGWIFLGCLVVSSLYALLFKGDREEKIQSLMDRVPVTARAEWGQQLIAKYPTTLQCQNRAGIKVLERLLDALKTPAYLNKPKLVISNDEAIKAFALPGKAIVLSSGLVKAANDPNILAGLIALEWAHQSLNHPATQLVRSKPTHVIPFLGGVSQQVTWPDQGIVYSERMQQEAIALAALWMDRSNLDAKPVAAFIANQIREKSDWVKQHGEVRWQTLDRAAPLKTLTWSAADRKAVARICITDVTSSRTP